MRTAGGISTEAVYIFHNMVRKLVSQHKPDYLAAIFESEGPTFRDEAFDAYKANRTETPPDLLDQIPWIRKTLEAMRIPVIEFPKYEADDVIGTLSVQATKAGLETVIVSSDKDMLQLVNPNVAMLNPMKDDTWYDAAETEKFMGVKPSQVADLLALKGDPVDNIPGAPGIGDAARDAWLSVIDGIEFGDDPAEGVIRGRRYSQARLGYEFTAPEGFVLENTQQALLGLAGGGSEALRLDNVRVPAATPLEGYIASGWVEGLQRPSIQACAKPTFREHL